MHFRVNLRTRHRSNSLVHARVLADVECQRWFLCQGPVERLSSMLPSIVLANYALLFDAIRPSRLLLIHIIINLFNLRCRRRNNKYHVYIYDTCIHIWVQNKIYNKIDGNNTYSDMI